MVGSEDHPRSCGEHLLSVTLLVSSEGSSPLVRGALFSPCEQKSRSGIIPARAGSTYKDNSNPINSEDHPRSCGEHSPSVLLSSPSSGSSPLVRGALGGAVARILVPGIIPARAGSTGTSCRAQAQPRDHPRSCGEHPTCMRCSSRSRGSSPLVRGALASRIAILAADGIIPARAGSTQHLLKSQVIA